MKVQRSLPLAAEEFTTVFSQCEKLTHQVAFIVSVSDPTKVLAYQLAGVCPHKEKIVI